jgi:hypothetical protein
MEYKKINKINGSETNQLKDSQKELNQLLETVDNYAEVMKFLKPFKREDLIIDMKIKKIELILSNVLDSVDIIEEKIYKNIFPQESGMNLESFKEFRKMARSKLDEQSSGTDKVDIMVNYLLNRLAYIEEKIDENISPSKTHIDLESIQKFYRLGLTKLGKETEENLSETEKIEIMLSDVIDRLSRIEDKINENMYPPESAIKPELIKNIRKAHTDIKKGKRKTYNSIDDFFEEIEV